MPKAGSKSYYEKGHGARMYVRKAEYNQVQHLPPPGNNFAEDMRAERERKIREAMTIGFQLRRLAGEMDWAREALPMRAVDDLQQDAP